MSPVLGALYWRPGSLKTDFQVLLLIYKTINGLETSNLREHSDHQLLVYLKVSSKKKIGDAAFYSYGPKLWNL